MGQWWPAAGLGALIVAVQAWDILKEATIIFITTTIVWPQVNNRKATTILFFPGTLTAPGLTRPRGFLMLLVQHLGHVVLLLLLDPEVRHVIPATWMN